MPFAIEGEWLQEKRYGFPARWLGCLRFLPKIVRFGLIALAISGQLAGLVVVIGDDQGPILPFQCFASDVSRYVAAAPDSPSGVLPFEAEVPHCLAHAGVHVVRSSLGSIAAEQSPHVL